MADLETLLADSRYWADQGSDPSAPSAGEPVSYTKSGLLYIRHSGGIVGPLIDETAHDALDHTGLTGVGGGGGGISSGTSFPGTPSDNDLYYRTDRDLLYYYNLGATNWLTVNQFDTAVANKTALTATTVPAIYIPISGTYSLWITEWYIITNVGGTNDGSKYWDLKLYKSDSAASTTLIGSGLTTSADTAGTWYNHVETIGAAVVPASFPLVRVDVTKVSTPGSLAWGMGYRFRLVG